MPKKLVLRSFEDSDYIAFESAEDENFTYARKAVCKMIGPFRRFRQANAQLLINAYNNTYGRNLDPRELGNVREHNLKANQLILRLWNALSAPQRKHFKEPVEAMRSKLRGEEA